MGEAKTTPSICGQRTVRIIFYFASCCVSQSTFYDPECSEEKQNREADAHVGLKVAQLGRCHLTEMKASAAESIMPWTVVNSVTDSSSE